MQAKNIYILIICLIKFVYSHGHSHSHSHSHANNHVTNNKLYDSEDSYDNEDNSNNLEYKIIGNTNIMNNNPIFNNFIDYINKRELFYSVVIKYYVTNIIFTNELYYAECLVYKIENSENITIFNIENITNYKKLIYTIDYKNSNFFNTNNLHNYCIKYYKNYSNSNSILMALFVFILLMCMLMCEPCNCCKYSYGRINLY